MMHGTAEILFLPGDTFSVRAKQTENNAVPVNLFRTCQMKVDIKKSDKYRTPAIFHGDIHCAKEKYLLTNRRDR
jgi:hypothetical protein